MAYLILSLTSILKRYIGEAVRHLTCAIVASTMTMGIQLAY